MKIPQRERRAHRIALERMECSPPRVLVACAQDAEALAIAELLTLCGLSADLVQGGEAAIGRVIEDETTDTQYALLMIDLFMPYCDGREAARALRIAGYPPGLLPIIALTGSEPDAQAMAAMRGAEIQGWLARPLTLETLVPVLNRWLPHRITGEGCGMPDAGSQI